MCPNAHMCPMCGARARVRVYYSLRELAIHHLTPLVTLWKTAAMDGRGRESPVEPLCSKL
eukprot:2619058-Prymnesium_polylepis.2